MTDYEDVLRTIGFGETALGRLRKDRISAFPRNYELLYTYASGFNFKLNRAIDAILANTGSLSAADIQSLYDTFLAPGRLEERVEEVGSRVTSEIGELSQLIAAALAAGGEYGSSLRAGAAELEAAETASAVKSIIGRLAAATAKAENENRKLEEDLASAQREMNHLKGSLELIRNEALTDPLTTLGNRKHFDQSIERAAADAERDRTPLALLMIDVDLFKRVNDTYGHQTGDQVLRLVGMGIKQSIKSSDIACRYGGEEFAVIMPRTQLAMAATVGDRIRQAVASRELIKRSTNENLGRVTVSVGAAAYDGGVGIQGLVGEADARLYAAKRAGRNRVVAADTPGGEVEQVA
ncbi:MAG: GGDEF domain-containing protein [Bauldia sp.]